MELDLSSNSPDREAERHESVVVKQASPTTERPPVLEDDPITATYGAGDRDQENVDPNVNLEQMDKEMAAPNMSPDDRALVDRKLSADRILSDATQEATNSGSSASANSPTASTPTQSDSSFEVINTPDNKMNSEEFSLVDGDDDDMPPLEYEETSAHKSASAPIMQSNATAIGDDNGSKTADIIKTAPTPQLDSTLKEDDDGWVDILGNGGLKKKVIKAGDGRDTRPTNGDHVTVHMKGSLSDGQEVDCHENFQFSVGEGDVIPALDLAVALTEVNETCQVYTQPKYAYGVLGSLPEIPADSDITYTVTLTDVAGPLDLDSLNIEERIKLGDAKRTRGNYYFSRNEHPQALSCYTKALELLDRPSGSESGETDQLQLLLDTKAKCYNNQAATQLKIEAFDAAVKSCDDVLRIQPDNVKALFRKGKNINKELEKALGCKGELEKAIAVLRKALRIEPESKFIHQELSRLVNEQRFENDKQRDMYKRMVGLDKEKHEPVPDSSMSMLIMTAAVLLLALLVAAYLYYLQNRTDRPQD